MHRILLLKRCIRDEASVDRDEVAEIRDVADA